MGGTDDSSNLIKLTVEEHALAHKKLWEEHGKTEDFIAYKALSGQITISEASKAAWLLGSYKGGYAKKPNNISSPNKVETYCVGCRKRVKPSAVKHGHIKCFQKKYGLPPKENISQFKKNELRCKKMAIKNNSLSVCPHCNKQGQYRAMKRWHFENCKLRQPLKWSIS
jgi:hypothetical protein